MTNADKFKSIFGLYATELWSKPEKDFLEWLNADNELFRNSEQPDVPDTNVGDMINRLAALDALGKDPMGGLNYESILSRLPSIQPEPLTDKEQRIFLAAMGREEKVCKEVDRNYVREPYEDSLMRVCKEIRRKVKGA